MKHTEGTTHYSADEGKMIERLSDNRLVGDSIYIGVNDSINNYAEREVTEEERAAFFESIGRQDPKMRMKDKKNHRQEVSNGH